MGRPLQEVLRGVTILLGIVAMAASASAQDKRDKLVVGALRSMANGPLFIAAGKNYFAAEGLDVDLKYYGTAPGLTAALAAGQLDIGATDLDAAVLAVAGKGTAKIIAAQAKESNGYEGNEILASDIAWKRGLRKIDDLPGHSFAITQLGSPSHYQIGRIAQLKKFDFRNFVLKTLQTQNAVSAAVAADQVDAAILPAPLARQLLAAGQARLIGWYSDLDEQQLGAVFALSRVIAEKRPAVEKFIRAYQRGAADFAVSLQRRDRFTKRIFDDKAKAVVEMIARYAYPTTPTDTSVSMIQDTAPYIDPQVRLDVGDILAQVEWYRAQGMIGSAVDPKTVVDLSFIKGHTNVPK